MNDALLVAPPYYYKTKVLTSSVKEYAGLGFLAAVLRENGYSVEILDADLAGYGIEQTLQEIIVRQARVIGLTVLQVAANVTIDLIKQLRVSGVDSHITVGGHFPSFATKELFRACREIDSIVIGEGDYTLLALVKALHEGDDWQKIEGIAYLHENQVVVNKSRTLVLNLDTLPFQARDTLPDVLKRGGPAAIISSRGCYGNCSFCSVNAFYKKSPGPKWRGRSPENIGAELEDLVKKWGAKIFVFNDDNFFGPGNIGKKRAYRIGEEILKRGLEIQFAIPAAVNDVDRSLFTHLKKAGLRSVFLGIESMLQRDLDFLHKHTTVEQNERAIEILEEVGIFYQIGFILFYPYSTLEEIKYNIEYLKERVIKNEYCGTQVFTGDLRILHGTSLEQSLKEKPFVHRDRFHYTYEIQDPRVERLRYVLDELILKKTFPLMVECKEDVMCSSMKRWIRVAICDVQLSMALKVIKYLERGEDILSSQIKTIIRNLNRTIQDLKEKMTFMEMSPEKALNIHSDINISLLPRSRGDLGRPPSKIPPLKGVRGM